MKINSKRKSNKKAWLLVVALVVVLLGLYNLVAWQFKYWPFQIKQSASTQDSRVINYEKSETEKAKEAEVKANPDQKTSNQNDTPPPPEVNQATGKQSVSVLISGAGVYDGYIEARGFASNTVEASGKCTYTFTNGSTVVKKTSSPLANASSTTCSAVRFPVGELFKGEWKVQLEFTSDKSYGQSDVKDMTV